MSAPQGSEAWKLDRVGRATASCFSDVLAKGKELRMRTKYLRRVLSERLTGKPAETYSGKHTERGQEQEDDARQAYEERTGAWAVRSGFLPHPELMAGCSPDSLIEADGALEIKSVIPTVQIDTVLREDCPPEHRAQIQGVLWITQRKWCDFVSWSPDMPEHLRLHIVRIARDEDYIENIEKEVRAFLAEVDQLYARLNDKRSMLDLLVASVDANHVSTQA